MAERGSDNLFIYALIFGVVAFFIYQVNSSSTSSRLEFLGNGVGAVSPTLSADLLPKEIPADQNWAQFAPKPSAELGGVALLDPVKFLGQSTSGVSRNNSLDLRMTIPVPKSKFPWNNSSLEPQDFRQHIGIDNA